VGPLDQASAELYESFTAAFARGWATCAISLDSVPWMVRREAAAVPTRTHGAAIGILEPQTTELAHGTAARGGDI